MRSLCITSGMVSIWILSFRAISDNSAIDAALRSDSETIPDEPDRCLTPAVKETRVIFSVQALFRRQIVRLAESASFNLHLTRKKEERIPTRTTQEKVRIVACGIAGRSVETARSGSIRSLASRLSI